MKKTKKRHTIHKYSMRNCASFIFIYTAMKFCQKTPIQVCFRRKTNVYLEFYEPNGCSGYKK